MMKSSIFNPTGLSFGAPIKVSYDSSFCCGGSDFITTSPWGIDFYLESFFYVGVDFTSELGTVSTDSSKFKASRELKYTDSVLACRVHRKIERIRGLILKSPTGLGGTHNKSSCWFVSMFQILMLSCEQANK